MHFNFLMCTITSVVYHQLNYFDVKRRRLAQPDVSGGGMVESEGERLLSLE